MRFTFSKADRLLKRREFIELKKSGRRLQNDDFIVYFLPGRYGRSRLGITVTKKVGGAVERNRIKRLVREFFRLNRHCISGNWDMNIIVKMQASGISSGRAFQSLKDICERLSGIDFDK